MKCFQLLLWAMGAVSFAYAAGEEISDLEVEEVLHAVNDVNAAANDTQPTVDYNQCDNFGLHRCGFSCITHALEYLGCPSRYDVRCLCEHQNEIQKAAARCVITNCGRKKAESILRKAKRGCAAYYSCTAVPKTTTLVGIGVQTITFPFKGPAVATDAPADAAPADAVVTAAPAVAAPSIVMIDD